MRRLLIVIAALFLATSAAAASRDDAVAELKAFLAIPNVAADPAGLERNAAWIVDAFGRRHLAARLLRVPGAPPMVLAEWRVPGARETIAYYAHYDGQPVDPTQWSTPPFSPVLKDDRLYARSASDDKAPIVAMLAAIDDLRSRGRSPSANLKFVFEGEEEAGSPHLADYLQRYAGDLATDAWMICDGPVHQSRRMQLYFGARGVTDVEVTVYGPAHALHSGHYGNWAPNPIVALTHLIDSMRDANGRILIPGFYDDVVPLTASERAALAEFPPVEEQLRRDLALGRSEGGSLAESILNPALNLRGIAGGHVGSAAANAIPTEATASIDIRLVPNETPESVRARIETFLAKDGWFIVHDAPDVATRLAHPNVVRLAWGDGYPPARTAMDSPLGRRTAAAIAKALGVPPLLAPSLGGSVPMYLFQQGGRTPVIGVPIVNHDNNQHAANENLRLQNFREGIDVFIALFENL